MKRRQRTDRPMRAIADAFDDLPDAAFFGVMDEFGFDVSSMIEHDNAARPGNRKKSKKSRTNLMRGSE